MSTRQNPKAKIRTKQLTATIFVLLFAITGVYVLTHIFAYGTTNAAQLDDGTCGAQDQMGSYGYSWTATPTILLWGDGGASSYQAFIDGTSIGTFNGTNRGVVCITDTTPLSNGSHVFTANELFPKPSNPVPAFTFNVNTTPAPVPTDLSLDPATNSNVSGYNVTTSSDPEIDGVSGARVEIELYVNGKLIGGSSTNESGTFRIPTIALSPGVYNITANSSNDAGLWGAQSAPITIYVNTTPPTSSSSNNPTPKSPAKSASGPSSNSSQSQSASTKSATASTPSTTNTGTNAKVQSTPPSPDSSLSNSSNGFDNAIKSGPTVSKTKPLHSLSYKLVVSLLVVLIICILALILNRLGFINTKPSEWYRWLKSKLDF